MKRIVFICEANSIRSQLAEGLARYFWLGRNVHVESAGSCNGGGVNYFVKTVLQEMKIDCSLQHSKSFENIIDPESVDVVVILCSRDFIGDFFINAQKIHYPLDIPSVAFASYNQYILDGYRQLGKQILDLFKIIKL